MIFRVKTMVAVGLATSFFVGTLAARNAMAQSDAGSGYATRTLDALKNRNSANYYSVDNIRRQNLSRAVPSVGVAGVNGKSFFNLSGIGSRGSSRPVAKPFSSINRGPSVSPYLALNNSFNSASDYYNIVRPQQEQARRNQQMQRQIQANHRRIGEYTARPPFSPQGDPNAAPTGHAAVFQNLGSYLTTGNYFPPRTRPKSQR